MFDVSFLFASGLFDVEALITGGGLALIALIIFMESGMMVGFFFPGDTLLLSAGILAAAGHLSLPWAIVVIAAAAIAGDNTGYQIGKTLGPRLFKKKDSIIFRKEYIDKAEVFYEKHGSKTMLVAHFVPIVRSFAPVTAGAANMNRKQFIIYDALGDIVWAASLTLFGYFVASKIPGIENYIEPMLIAIIIIFLFPTLFHALKDPKIRAALKAKFSKK